MEWLTSPAARNPPRAAERSSACGWHDFIEWRLGELSDMGYAGYGGGATGVGCWLVGLAGDEGVLLR